jgi:DNA topoisomerase VI subunit A
VDKGRRSKMALQVKSNNQTYVKLMSMSMLLSAAKEKVTLYMQKNYNVIQEMMEDEESMHYMNLYYEEQADELRECAQQSLFTAKEVEKLLEDLGD